MPQILQAAWTRRQPHPPPGSRRGVPGEDSLQQVACSLPFLCLAHMVVPGHVQGKEHADATALLS
jgi:hypothetical protein